METAMFLSLVVVVLATTTLAFPNEPEALKFLSSHERHAYRQIRALSQAFTEETTLKTRSRVGKFSFKNCGNPSTDLVDIKSLSLGPDPIKLPGNITVSLDSVTKAKVGAPMSAHLKVYKEVIGFWIEVPCIDNIGSCTYDDLCPLINKTIKTCPPELVKQGFNCECPFPAKPLVIKDVSFDVKKSVPSIADGDIKVHAVVESGSKQVMCVEIVVTLK